MLRTPSSHPILCCFRCRSRGSLLGVWILEAEQSLGSFGVISLCIYVFSFLSKKLDYFVPHRG
ncbi:uncharacterized protein DS421_12g361920 [Arachis hypogaea]|nr:uncharacterized protein DS421_12g361920 [Arachis hypogaea]